MNLVLLIYLVEMVGNLKSAIVGVCIFSPFIVGLILMMTADYYDSPQDVIKRHSKTLKKFAFIWCSLIALLPFIPKKETVQLMVGVYIGQEIIAEPKTKELLGETYDVLLNSIKKLNKELTNESK